MVYSIELIQQKTKEALLQFKGVEDEYYEVYAEMERLAFHGCTEMNYYESNKDSVIYYSIIKLLSLDGFEVTRIDGMDMHIISWRNKYGR